jgi:hypothetical protein
MMGLVAWGWIMWLAWSLVYFFALVCFFETQAGQMFLKDRSFPHVVNRFLGMVLGMGVIASTFAIIGLEFLIARWWIR